jgi:hypothetical protein
MSSISTRPEASKNIMDEAVRTDGEAVGASAVAVRAFCVCHRRERPEPVSHNDSSTFAHTDITRNVGKLRLPISSLSSSAITV